MLRVLVVRAALQADSPLPHRRQHPRRVEDFGDAVGEAEARQPRLRQHDRVEALLVELPQPRLDVAAEVDELQVRSAVEHLRPAAEAAGADRRPVGKLIEPAVLVANEGVAGRAAGRDGGEFEPRLGDGRQVLETVHGDVGPAVEQGVLDRLGEHAEPAHRRQGGRLVAVAVRLDEHQLDRPRVGDRPQPVGDVVRLPQGEAAAAGAQLQRRVTSDE